MKNDNYKPPASELGVPVAMSSDKYFGYDEVPVYRRQWFFWLMYVLFSPVALVVLCLGDIYYVKKGRVVGFGLANRLAAGAVALYVLYLFVANVVSG